MTDFPFTLTPDRDLIGQLVDHTVMLSTEAQTAFAERYQGRPWRVDLTEPAVFWFEREPAAIFRPHFIGSTSDATQTWLWGWENVNGFPDPVVALARHVRDVGERHGSAELTTAYQQLEPADRVGQELAVRDIPEHVFLYCAQALSGLTAPVYYRGPSGSGYAWFVLDNPAEFALPEPTTMTTAFAITRALQTGYVVDHRLAVTAYVQRRDGLSVVVTGPDALVIGAGDGEVTVTFDGLGRFAGVATGG